LPPDCGGFTPNSGSEFQVTVADPSRSIITIVTSTGTYTGALSSDYSFYVTDPTASASLDGRFRRENGMIVMTTSAPLGNCTPQLTANKVGCRLIGYDLLPGRL
jgi:hypothetical protein